eukprot:5301957-Pyramimonas_sp.AAC.1
MERLLEPARGILHRSPFLQRPDLNAAQMTTSCRADSILRLCWLRSSRCNSKSAGANSRSHSHVRLGSSRFLL